jgi:hypothetical protein
MERMTARGFRRAAEFASGVRKLTWDQTMFLPSGQVPRLPTVLVFRRQYLTGFS